MAAKKSSPPPPTTPIAVGLVRCSTDRQEHSVEDQEAEIRTWVRQSGMQVVRVFGDEGISGSELDRPGMNDLLEFLRRSPDKGTVVAWCRNRMARPTDLREGLFLEWTIEQLGWKLHYLQDPSPTGDALVDTILSAVGFHQAGQYLQGLSRDTIRGQVKHILRGGMTSGRIPYGYMKVVVDADGNELRRVPRRHPHRALKGEQSNYVPGDPAEVEAVGWIYREYASGKYGLADLAEDLNRRQVEAPLGGGWKSGTIRDILINPVYTGDMTWNRETTSKFHRIVAGGVMVPKDKARRSTRKTKRTKNPMTSYAANERGDWIVVPNHHPALVERELWERAQKVRESRAVSEGGRRWVKYCFPLTGIVHCGNCGGRMVGHSPSVKGHVYRRYTCASYHQNRECRPFWVYADKLEAAVAQRLRDTYREAVERARHEDLKGHIVAVLQEIYGNADPGVDVESLQREKARLEKKVSNAIERIADLEQASVAKRLATEVEVWSRRVGEIDQQLVEARSRTHDQSRAEMAADRVLGLLKRLGQTIEKAPREEMKAFYGEALDRIDLRFVVHPPEETGKKRNKLEFVGGNVRANALLADTSRALATSEVSSGRTRTYNQVVNSHLLYH